MKRVRSLRQVRDFLVWSKKNLSPAAQEATREYWKEELPKRFQHGNVQIYNYTANKPEYDLSKNGQPNLVVSGGLRDRAVSSIKVNKNGLKLNYPIYGRFQINQGRNWLQFRDKDLQAMRELTREIFRKWLKRKTF